MLALLLVFGSTFGGSFGLENHPEMKARIVAAAKETGLSTWDGAWSNRNTKSRVMFAPVFVPPVMQWAVPNDWLRGARSFPPSSAFPSFPSYGYPARSDKSVSTNGPGER